MTVSAQTLPTVIVTVSRARLIEGTLPEGNAAFFVFSSSDTRGAVLRVEFSGDASAEDFSEILQSPAGGVHRELPTSILIPEGSASTTLSFQSANDLLVEGAESFAVRIVPDAMYQIGASSEVGFSITDRTVLSTNKGVSIGIYPRSTNVVLQPMIGFSVGVGGYETLDLRLMVDNEVVEQVFAASPPSTNVFTLNWRNPTLGKHTVQFVAYDENGGTAVSPPAEINVVAAILRPTRAFTLSLPAGNLVGTNVSVFGSGGGAERQEGFVEFDVPASATNLEAMVQFGGRVSQRFDLFAYATGATDFREVMNAPREHIMSIATNAGPMMQIDVTPWVRELAGGKLGMVAAMPEIATADYAVFSLTNFTLLLQEPAEMDAGPHVRWLAGAPRIARTNSVVTVRAEISDPDSHISRVYLLDGEFVAGIDAPATPYPPGTNIVSFNVQLVSGMHTLSVQAASAGKIALSEQRLLFVSTSNPVVPERRWLGSQGDSGSFYVLDAAGRAFVWGRNDYGQLGLGFTNAASEYGLKHPVTLLAPEGLEFRQIASARHYAMGLMNDGSLYAWGTNKLTPARVALPRGVAGFLSVGARDVGPVATDHSGVPWFWSANDAMWTSRTNRGRDVKAGAGAEAWAFRSSQPTNTIVWSSRSVSGIKYAPTSGELYVISTEGQLDRWSPGSITSERLTANGAASWRDVAASDNYVLAIDEQGRLWSWDRGFFAAGLSTEGVLVPLPAEATNIVEIAATSTIAMLLTDQGEVYAWGDAAVTRFVPEKVNGLPNVFDASATRVAAAFVLTAEIKLAAPAGMVVPIAVSDDLMRWTSYTNLVMKSGVTILDLPSDATGQRFFRVGP